MSEMDRSPPGLARLRDTGFAPGVELRSDPRLVEAVETNLFEHFGAISQRWRPADSTESPIYIAILEPTELRPTLCLATVGMSLRGMSKPEGDGSSAPPLHAELILHLPPSRPRPGFPGFEAERVSWPFTLVYELAHLPHWFDTRLWIGDTVPNGDPPVPYADDTDLMCALIAPQLLAPTEAAETIEYAGRTIHRLGVTMLYEQEVRYKIEHGIEPLWELLDAGGIVEALQLGRPSVC